MNPTASLLTKPIGLGTMYRSCLYRFKNPFQSYDWEDFSTGLQPRVEMCFGQLPESSYMNFSQHKVNIKL
jgi:hypothetical protein